MQSIRTWLGKMGSCAGGVSQQSACRGSAVLQAGLIAALLFGAAGNGFTQTVQRAAKPAPAAKPVPAKPAQVVTTLNETGAVTAETPVRLVWNRTPLPLGLQVGTERMITFPAPVRLGIPPEVAPLIRAQLVDKTAYVVASAPFTKARIVAENPVNGTVILLDVTAAKSVPATAPVEIFNDRKPEPQDAVTARLPRAATDDSVDAAAQEVDEVMLSRYAAQQVYAPRRLIKALPGVRQLQVDLKPVEGLYRGASIRAEPIGGWRSPDYYVTAVKLTNTGAVAVELDPRHLRGQWRAATFQHTRVLPAGNEEDTTVVYLISDRRFEEAR
jgi:integrating conjugative element protein (TIGR03749 family)